LQRPFYTQVILLIKKRLFDPYSLTVQNKSTPLYQKYTFRLIYACNHFS